MRTANTATLKWFKRGYPSVSVAVDFVDPATFFGSVVTWQPSVTCALRAGLTSIVGPVDDKKK